MKEIEPTHEAERLATFSQIAIGAAIVWNLLELGDAVIAANSQDFYNAVSWLLVQSTFFYSSIELKNAIANDDY